MEALWYVLLREQEHMLSTLASINAVLRFVRKLSTLSRIFGRYTQVSMSVHFRPNHLSYIKFSFLELENVNELLKITAQDIKHRVLRSALNTLE